MRIGFTVLVWLFFATLALASPAAEVDPPRVGDDNCPATAALSCLLPRLFDSGTTAGANDTVTQLVGGCQGLVSVPGADVIYKLSIGPQDIFGASLFVTPAAGYDVAIYLLRDTGTGCPSGVLNGAANCVAAANAGGPGVSESIPFETLISLPAGTYYLFIDSPVATGPSSAGSYNAQVVSICPVELLDFSVE